ncbi:MAG: cytochrome ubiquinol oxidase subunit I [Spirochaetae bacterium HGW-Spirochaetae-5]|nr:MAG: cytochrome ubiquinol oxidase subunit I [Spirochaetae bacterium HGW-Spirochaetae-5]
MDAVFLSRIQFAFTAAFHFIFPTLTLGMGLLILINETIYLKTDKELYKNISKFMIKIFALIFTLGVSTGIVLEFSFGTNWSSFSRIVGDIFGAPLAAEGVLAFFLESVFLGVLLFGRDKISKKAYWVSAFLVFFGSHLSGLWIIIANSWMQTPAGFVMEGGRAVLTDFFAAAVNHSTAQRFIHTVVGGWMSGSLFMAGISAWYILKKRDLNYAKPILKLSLIVFITCSFLQFGAGHYHAVQVAKTQPVKMAAFEGLWDTEKGAGLSVFGFPVESEKKTYLDIRIPRLLSLMIHGNLDGEVQGLNDFPTDLHPPVFLTFQSYHVMIGLGGLFALISSIGLLLMIRKKLYETDWFLKVLLFSIPLPVISNEMGWMAAEIGRQPWIIQGVLKTADAASVVVPAWQVLATIIMFTILYALLFLFFIKFLVALIKKGPEKVIATDGY